MLKQFDDTTKARSVAMSFINLINKKLGPGVLIPMLLGKYRNPREEERIFMFMDLKASTTLQKIISLQNPPSSIMFNICAS
jgi:hypothetical protein